MGLFLDPWQQWVLEQSLGERPDGRWAAFQVCLLCPRQNGKGSILEARELAGLFLFGEKKIVHSAHEAKTAKDHFERMETLLRDAGYGDDEIIYRRSTTEVSILVKSTGCKLQFYTRTNDGGRGLVGDMVVLDEAFALTRDQMAALMPTMAARSMTGNPQMWFTSSAGFEDSEVLAQKKAQGEAGYERLAYFDWSASPGSELTDREVWAEANPGLGFRISEEFIADELPDLGPAGFARERLGLWEEYADGRPISSDAWASLAVSGSVTGTPSFFLDCSPGLRSASIAGATLLDGRPHVKLADYRAGTEWVPARVKELVETYPGASWQFEGTGPASALAELLKSAGVTVEKPFTGTDMARGCAHLQKLVDDEALSHSGDEAVTVALASAVKRDIGDPGLWAWGRRKSAGDISPLVAVTGALWLLESSPPTPFFGTYR